VNKKAVERLCEGVTALRANGFETLAEVAVFFEVAIATMNSKLSGVTEISRALDLPNSTVSRHVWDLSQRGFLEYTADPKDRRVKLIRARLDVFE
jgi:DNA-binding MarR family transcriptional regulator